MGYIGILDCTEGAWGVRIPDLPGCYGAGSSHEEAMIDAAEAVLAWIEHQRARGVAMPIARNVDALIADPDTEFDATTEAVVVLPPVHGAPVAASTGIKVDSP